MADLDHLSQFFIHAFPSLDTEGKAKALTLYNLLASGNPVPVEQFARAIEMEPDATRQLLDEWTGVYFSDTGDIVGFWGLNVTPMPHRIMIDDKQLYTWCAWDTLFIPMILNKTCQVITTCPVSQQDIQLTVSSSGIETMRPGKPVISFIEPELEKLKENVINSFCQQIFFLGSETEGNTWTRDHPDAFILSMEDGFRLGQKIVHQVLFS